MLRGWFSSLTGKVFGRTKSNEEQISSDIGTCVDSGQSQEASNINANCDIQQTTTRPTADCGAIVESKTQTPCEDECDVFHNSNSSLDYATCSEADHHETDRGQMAEEKRNYSAFEHIEEESVSENQKPSSNDNTAEIEKPESMMADFGNGTGSCVLENKGSYNVSDSVLGDGKGPSVTGVRAEVPENAEEDKHSLNAAVSVLKENTSSPTAVEQSTVDSNGLRSKPQQSSNLDVAPTSKVVTKPVEVSHGKEEVDTAVEPAEGGSDISGKNLSDWVSLEMKDTCHVKGEADNRGMEVVQVITSNQTVTRTTEKLTNTHTKTGTSLEDGHSSEKAMDVMATECSYVTDEKEEESMDIEHFYETEIITATVGGSPTTIINISQSRDSDSSSASINVSLDEHLAVTADHCYSKVTDFKEVDTAASVGLSDNLKSDIFREEIATDPSASNVTEEGSSQTNGANPLVALEQDKVGTEKLEDLSSSVQALSIGEKDQVTCDDSLIEKEVIVNKDGAEMVDKAVFEEYIVTCIDKAVASAEKDEENFVIGADDTEQDQNLSLNKEQFEESPCPENTTERIKGDGVSKEPEDPSNFLLLCQHKTSGNHIMDPKRLIYGLGHMKHVPKQDIEAAIVGQYKIAVHRNLKAWVKDLRYYAEILFSTDWIDENLPSLLGKKRRPSKRSEKRRKRSEEEENSASATGDGMCHDVRLKTDPSIHVLRENAMEAKTKDEKGNNVDHSLNINTEVVTDVLTEESTANLHQQEGSAHHGNDIVDTSIVLSKKDNEREILLPATKDTGKERPFLAEENYQDKPFRDQRSKEQLFPVAEGSGKKLFLAEENVLLAAQSSEKRQNDVGVDSAKGHDIVSNDTGKDQCYTTKNSENPLTQCFEDPKNSVSRSKGRSLNQSKINNRDKKDQQESKRSRGDDYQGAKVSKKKGKKKTNPSKDKNKSSVLPHSDKSRQKSSGEKLNTKEGRSCENKDKTLRGTGKDLSNDGVAGVAIIADRSVEDLCPSSTSISNELSCSVPGDCIVPEKAFVSYQAPGGKQSENSAKENKSNRAPTGKTSDKSTKKDKVVFTAIPEDSFTDPAIICQIKSPTVELPSVLMKPLQGHLTGDENIQDHGLITATSALQQILRISPEPDVESLTSTAISDCFATDPCISSVAANDQNMADTELDGRGAVEYDAMNNPCTSLISELTDRQDIGVSISQLVMETGHVTDIDPVGDPGYGEAVSFLDPEQDNNLEEINLHGQNGVSIVTEEQEGSGEARLDPSTVEQDMENNVALCSQNISTVHLRNIETRCCVDSNGIDVQVEDQLSQSAVDNVKVTDNDRELLVNKQSSEEAEKDLVSKDKCDEFRIPVVVTSRAEVCNTDQHTAIEDTDQEGLIEHKNDAKTGTEPGNTFQTEFLKHCQLEPVNDEEFNPTDNVDANNCPSKLD